MYLFVVKLNTTTRVAKVEIGKLFRKKPCLGSICRAFVIAIPAFGICGPWDSCKLWDS